MDQAEKLRTIVKKNQQNSPKAQVFAVTSGKGGVGKSNVAVNLAVQMQKLGKKVMPRFNLSDLIYRGKTIQEVITPGPLGIGFISGGSGITGVNNLSREQLRFLVGNLAELDDFADVIIIDTGAGISDSVLEFVITSPEILLVVTPEPSSLTDAYSLLKTLHRSIEFRQANTRIRVISNRVESEEEGVGIYEKLNSVVGQFLNGTLEYLGMIPQDTALGKAVCKQKPVSLLFPESKSAKAFVLLADYLIQGEVTPVIQKRGIMQLLSRFIYRKN